MPGLASMVHGGAYLGYDSGGFLEPGLTLAYNATGRREVVVPNRAGKVGGGAGVVNYIDLRGTKVMSDADIDTFMDRIGNRLTTWDPTVRGCAATSVARGPIT